MSELFFIYNNDFYKVNTPVITPENRAFRYGDGLFETMKIVHGKIINKDFHFERLFKGLAILKFEVPKFFNSSFIEKKINELISKNNHNNSLRLRLVIFRGNGGIFEIGNSKPNYIIESWPISAEMILNENGLVVDIFPEAGKSCDIYSNLKSNNYLPHVMAGIFAKRNKLNDAILLNTSGRVCESVIANIFIIKSKKIFTPPLSEGCVAGTMRRWMLEKYDLKKYTLSEKKLTISDLVSADEFFLTNSIHPIRWVKNFKEKVYNNIIIKELFHHVQQTI